MTVQPTTSTAYETKKELVSGILQELVAEENLKNLAEGIAASNIPIEYINDSVVAKVLFNCTLYQNYESVAELANSTELRGLGKRPFAKLSKIRRRLPAEQPQTTIVANENTQNTTIPRYFMKANYIAADNYFNNIDPSFIGTLKTAVTERNNLFRDVVNRIKAHEGSSLSMIGNLVREELRIRSNSGASRVSALVPLNVVLPKIAGALRTSINMSIFSALCECIRQNLQATPKPGKPCVELDDLPAEDSFKERYLMIDGEANSEHYFRSHRTQLWDTMFNCYAFSMVGRNLNYTDTVTEQLSRVITPYDRGLGNMVRDKVLGSEVLCVISPDRESTPRLHILGIYRGEILENLLLRALDGDSCNRSRATNRSSTQAMLDTIAVSIMSMTADSAPEYVQRFSAPIGKYRMW